MNTFENLPPDEQARIEIAVSWRQRLRQNPVLELSSEYLEWISDPANCRVLSAVEEALDALDDVASAPEILDLRQDALNLARRGLPRRKTTISTAARFAAALLVTIGIGGGMLHFYVQTSTSYETGVGERRVVALSDGSRISMDSDSEVHVRYSVDARAVVLDRGRARFDVAHDVKRPFSVKAGTETVIAVGTSFNVERLGSTVLVTLIQGHVVIKNSAPVAAAPHQPVRQAVSLMAGQELVAAANTKPAVQRANLQVANAWEAGRLVFEDESLSEAVERVNRYTDKPISVDPSVASIRINGVFNAGDVGSFVSAVTSYFPVQASTDADNNIVLQRRS